MYVSTLHSFRLFRVDSLVNVKAMSEITVYTDYIKAISPFLHISRNALITHTRKHHVAIVSRHEPHAHISRHGLDSQLSQQLQ